MALEVLKKDFVPIPADAGVRVNWGSIFSGAFITSGIALLVMTLGSLIGFPSLVAINPMVPEAVGISPSIEAPFVWNWIYTFITLSAAFFVGGYCAARIGGVREATRATLHGLSTWGVVIVFSVLFVVLTSPYIEQLLAGTIPSASGWLVFCTLASGFIFSMLGGFTGRTSRVMTQTLVEHEGGMRAAG